MAKLRMAHASMHGARELPGPKEQTMVITMAKLRMAHASTHGARKPPGPKLHSNLEKFLYKIFVISVSRSQVQFPKLL